jgi:hypothetical protein
LGAKKSFDLESTRRGKEKNGSRRGRKGAKEGEEKENYPRIDTNSAKAGRMDTKKRKTKRKSARAKGAEAQRGKRKKIIHESPRIPPGRDE